MRKASAGLFVFIIAIIILFFIVFYQEGKKLEPVPFGQLPEAGLTPRNPFYFMDIITENFLLLVYTDPRKEAEVTFRFAKEKLAEIKQLEIVSETASSLVIQEASKKAAEKARRLYDEYLLIAHENLVKSTGSDKTVRDLTYEYLDEVLSTEVKSADNFFQKIYNNLPESVRTKLSDFGNWIGSKWNAFIGFLEIQKAKSKDFLRGYLKQKASDYIDNTLDGNATTAQ